MAFLSLPGEDPSALMEPFQGFSKQGLAPIYKLFDASAEGRSLLRKARRKLKFSQRSQLASIFSFCNGSQLGGGRRGLFMYRVDYLYRPKDEQEWQGVTPGSLDKLKKPRQYPIFASKSYYTQHFEHREVVFQPSICIAPGMSVLDTYLVLVHELTHLVETEPFDTYELMHFDEDDPEDSYYFKELRRDGGEVDAYLAQMKALLDIRERFDLNIDLGIEHYLTDQGRLSVAQKAPFMRHLLYKLGYDALLDYQLQVSVFNHYNMAQVWWAYFDKNIDTMEEYLDNLEAEINRCQDHMEKIEQQGVDSSKVAATCDTLREKHANVRQRHRIFKAERDARIELMEALDAKFPEED